VTQAAKVNPLSDERSIHATNGQLRYNSRLSEGRKVFGEVFEVVSDEEIIALLDAAEDEYAHGSLDAPTE
jgi:hypothetical protein